MDRLFRLNELLLLVGRIVIFGIKADYQSKVCDKSRLNQGLKDKETGYIKDMNDKTSDTSLKSLD